MVSAPTAILGYKLPLYVKKYIHNSSFIFFTHTHTPNLSTVADDSDTVSYIYPSIITNSKAQDFSSYAAKQPYSFNSTSFCSWALLIPVLMYKGSRDAAHIFISISTKKILTKAVHPLSL